MKDGRALEPLVRAFYEDTEWLVRFSAAVSLGNLQDIRSKQVLLKALDSSETVVQHKYSAIAALGEIKAIGTVEAILKFASSEDWLIRQRLSRSLGEFTLRSKPIRPPFLCER